MYYINNHLINKKILACFLFYFVYSISNPGDLLGLLEEFMRIIFLVVVLVLTGCATVDSGVMARLDRVDKQLNFLYESVDAQNKWNESTTRQLNENILINNEYVTNNTKNIEALAVGVKALLEESMARDSSKTGSKF